MGIINECPKMGEALIAENRGRATIRTNDMTENSEIGQEIMAAGIRTNYHDAGQGQPVLLIHGSGPGVSAWANWRATIPDLAKQRRVVAPDMVGFGFTERPTDAVYGLDLWVAHVLGLLDALNLDRVDVVGNSFGGALALTLAVRHPSRVRKLVLMGSVGVEFDLTAGLDMAWGYEPSVEAMRALLGVFAYDNSRITDDLVQMRYEASIRPGFQESFSKMFPAPRQQCIRSLAVSDDALQSLEHEVLIFHGREDRIIPMETSHKLFRNIPNAELHMFGKCGHWTQIERMNRFNDLVNDFLDA